MEAAWEQLSDFAQSDTQRVWIQQELLRHPPVAGQDPFAWLLWRSKIAEGMTEAEAWEWVVKSSSGGGEVVEQSEHTQTSAGEDVQMVMAQPTPLKQYGFAQTEVAPSQPPQHTGYNATSLIPTSGTTSMLLGSAAPSMQSAEPRTVQMNDILPLPFASVPYDSTEDAMGSLDPSGSSGSSADGDGSEEEVDELEEEDVKPAIPDLPRAGPSMTTSTEVTSHDTPFDLVPPQCDSDRLFTVQPSRFTVGPSRFRGEPYPTYGTSPYAATPRAIANRVRPRKDSSSIDPPPPRPVVPRGASQSRSPTKSSVPVPPVAKNEPVTMALIRTLITREKLRSDRPGALWKYLRRQADGAEPPKFEPTPAELREIAGAIRLHAPYIWKQEMADNWKYAEQIGRWLKMMYKDPKEWEVAIPPLFILLSETDISVTVLIKLKYGRLVPEIDKKATEEKLPNSENISKACEKFLDQCKKKLIPANREIPLPVKKDDDAPKKRKIDEVASGTSTTSAPKPIAAPTMPERKTSLSATTDLRPKAASVNAAAGPSRQVPPTTNPAPVGSTSMSFFAPPSSSGPTIKRPKTLPAFKKRDPAATANTVQSSSAPSIPISAPTPTTSTTSLLAATLARAKEAQAALTGAASANAAVSSSVSLFPDARSEPKVKLNKKGHSVRFRDLVSDGGALYEERLFKEEPWELEPAPWGNDEDGEDVHGMSSHDMTLNEGMVFKKEHAEHPEPAEIIEWYEPVLYNDAIPPATPESLAQEARERGILAAPGGVPDESTVRVVDPHPSMTFNLPEALVSASRQPVQQTVSQLLSNLTNLGTLSNLGIGGAVGGIGGIGGQVPAATNYYSQPPAAYPNQQQGYGANTYGCSAAGPPGQNPGWGQGSGYINGYNQEPQNYGQPQPPQERRWGNAGGNGWGMAASGPPNAGGDAYDRSSGGSGGSGGKNRRSGGGQGGRGGNGGYKSRPCKYFAKGTCLDGANCTFQH